MSRGQRIVCSAGRSAACLGQCFVLQWNVQANMLHVSSEFIFVVKVISKTLKEMVSMDHSMYM